MKRFQSRYVLAGVVILSAVFGGIWLLTHSTGSHFIENHSTSGTAQTPESRNINGPAGKSGTSRYHVKKRIPEERVTKISRKIVDVLKESRTSARQDRLALLVEQLVEQEGIGVAIKIFAELAGPGRDREWMIAAAVGKAPDSVQEVLKIGRELELRGDLAAFHLGISSLVQRRGFMLNEWTELGPYSKEELGAIVSGAGLTSFSGADRGPHFEKRTDAVVSMIESMANQKDAASLLGKYFMSLSMLDPILSLNLMLKSEPKIGVELKDGFELDQIFSRAVDSNPEKVLVILTEEGSTREDRETSHLIEKAIASWIRNDKRAAENWFLHESQRNNTPEAIVPFLRFELREGNLEEARVWLERISDPDAKKRAEGEIWKVEKEMLQRQVVSEPVKTIQSIVSGQSSFTDYWLEEALNTWASRDFDAATKWHEENWHSLPKEKAQYVAAAFATQAIGAGDVAVAKQWSALIQDAKTKARIEAAITKAAAAP